MVRGKERRKFYRCVSLVFFVQWKYVITAVLFTNYGLLFLPRLWDGENAAGQKQPTLQGMWRAGSLYGADRQDFYLGIADFYRFWEEKMDQNSQNFNAIRSGYFSGIGIL